MGTIAGKLVTLTVLIALACWLDHPIAYLLAGWGTRGLASPSNPLQDQTP
jgi:hypothetical protein